MRNALLKLIVNSNCGNLHACVEDYIEVSTGLFECERGGENHGWYSYSQVNTNNKTITFGGCTWDEDGNRRDCTWSESIGAEALTDWSMYCFDDTTSAEDLYLTIFSELGLSVPAYGIAELKHMESNKTHLFSEYMHWYGVDSLWGKQEVLFRLLCPFFEGLSPKDLYDIWGLQLYPMHSQYSAKFIYLPTVLHEDYFVYEPFVEEGYWEEECAPKMESMSKEYSI